MKKVWVALLLAGISLGMGSCMKEDIDDIRKELQEHNDRLTSLEEWQKSINASISSLQSLVEALEGKDYVTGVTPLADGSGYEISFLKSGTITIKHGEKGDTPVISVKQDTDEKYYWTVNGEWLLDGDNNKMPVTGEKGEQGDPGTSAIAPQVRIDPTSNEWEISTDGGDTWTSTGVKATGDKGEQGDAIFAKDGIDYTTSAEYVKFTLADGTTIQVPKYIANPNAVHVATGGGLEQALENAGLAPYTITELTITGTLGTKDFQYMRDQLDALNHLDISGTNLTGIGTYAFEGMPIETIVLPKGLKEIREGAFYGCKSLRSLDIPASVETLGQWIVWDCNQLQTVTLHNGLKTLSANTFSNCGISSITIPSTVKEIPNQCFSTCKNLERIYLHDDITSIGASAFYECYSLKSFTAPKSLTVLSDNVFYTCKNLSLVLLHDDIESIGDNAFNGCELLRRLLTYEESTEYDVIRWPLSLTTIGAFAFQSSGLEEVYIKDSPVTTIPQEAFRDCKNLTKVTLSNELKTIGNSAFYNTPITDIIIPAKVTNIENLAFWSCKSLIKVVSEATTAPALGSNAFAQECKTQCQLVYPTGGTGYDAWTSYFKK